MSDFDEAMEKAWSDSGLRGFADKDDFIAGWQAAKQSMQGEAVAEIKNRDGSYNYIHWHTALQLLPVGTKLYTHAPDSAARIAELEAENEALRKDAERYKKLREVIILQPGGQYAFATYMGWIPETFKHGFDQAIDAAIRQIRSAE